MGARGRGSRECCVYLRSMQTEVAVVVELGPWAVDRGPWRGTFWALRCRAMWWVPWEGVGSVLC